MNQKQTLDWLAAVQGCFPELKTAAARDWVAERGAGAWEGGITGAGFERVDLRLTGSPWLETRWDLSAGTLERTSDGRGRRAGRFDPRSFPDAAVARALAEFAALAPVATRIVEGKRRWALRLAGRLPWPAFLRCEISAAFTARSAQIALLTPAHAVRELSFEGESLWAYFEG